MQRNEARKLEDSPSDEPDAILCRFFAKIRKRDDREYEPGSLAVMQCSLDRHLKNCCRNYSIKMISAQHSSNNGKNEFTKKSS